MRNGVHTTARQRNIPRLLPLFIVAFPVISVGVLAQPPQTTPGPGLLNAAHYAWVPQVQPQPQMRPQQQTDQEHREMLVRLLSQLQQTTREIEAVLRQRDGETGDQERPWTAQEQGLYWQIQAPTPQTGDLTSIGPVDGNAVEPPDPTETQRRLDQRREQLTEQRQQLERTAEEVETRLRQLQAGREEERRRLQVELEDCRQRLQNLDEQLDELRRERLRADYQAALQAREQARKEQARAQAEAQRTSETQKQIAALSEQLKQLQEQAADRQRRALEPYIQQLGRRQEELEKSTQAGLQELHALQDQVRALQEQARAASEEAAKRSAEQHNVEQLRGELRQLHEQLRNQIVGMVEERLKAATAQTATGTEALRQELNRLGTDVQRMGQTLERMERERLDVQAGQRDQVQQLDRRIAELRSHLALVQGSLNMLLSQMGRSTVGSAGTTWAW